jgi:hypothetical protein
LGKKPGDYTTDHAVTMGLAFYRRHRLQKVLQHGSILQNTNWTKKGTTIIRSNGELGFERLFGGKRTTEDVSVRSKLLQYAGWKQLERIHILSSNEDSRVFLYFQTCVHSQPNPLLSTTW